MIVVANTDAGAAERLEDVVAVLRQEHATEVVATPSTDDLDRAILAAVGDRLVVAGGDGTLHAVVGRAHALGALEDLVFGLVPLGTGNDFARGLGIPMDPVRAAQQLLRARPRSLDLLVSDDHGVVVNAVHAGLGAAAATRSDGLKKALGPLAYPVGALIAGVAEAGYALQVTVDDTVVHDGDTLMVGVANASCIGGGTALCACAAPDDGLLDVIVVSAVAPAARTAFAAALRNGVHLEREDVDHVRGRRVTISGDEVAHDADGEILGPYATRTYQVVPAAWHFLASSR